MSIAWSVCCCCGRTHTFGSLQWFDKFIDEIISFFSKDISKMPSVYSQFLSAFAFTVGHSNEIIIVGDKNSTDTKEMFNALNSIYSPNKVVVFIPANDPADPIHKLAPYTSAYKSIDGKATVYVCRNRECKLPTTDISVMIDQLK